MRQLCSWSLLNHLIYFIFVAAVLFGHAIDVNTFSFLLMNFQIILFWVHQIFNTFIINFTAWYFNLKLNVLTRVFDSVENCSHHPRNNTHHFYIWDTWSHHCVWFTTTCLTVGEDGSVEAVNDGIDDWSCCVIINFLLGWFCIEDPVEIKFVLSLSWNRGIWHVEADIFLVLVEIQTAWCTPCYFWFIEWPDSACHHNISSTHLSFTKNS